MSDDFKAHRRLRLDVTNVGLEAQTVAIGFLQLCTELRRSGILDGDAIDRIKDVIADTVSMTPPRGCTCQQYRRDVMDRLEMILDARLDHGVTVSG